MLIRFLIMGRHILNPGLRRRHLFASALIVAIAAMAGMAHGETATPWAETAYSSVRLVSATSGVGNSQQVQFGLHFRMKKGWKV